MPDDPSLSDLIDMQIGANGPISIATYMALCLTHPHHGYYRTADAIGAAGDFITAPEISQMFGEMIGFFLVNLWQQLGEPKALTLVELGPGRGTLMDDIMRVAHRAPGFAQAIDLALHESHPGLKAEQEARLAPFHPRWIEDFELAEEGPLLVLANEFFDALPVRQFVRGRAGWNERMIGLANDKRRFGLSPTPIPPAVMPAAIADAPEGSVYEAGLAANELAGVLAKAVHRRGGAMVLLDYGYAFTQTGETLQAISRHAFADPLEAPGTADISAHVDFGALSVTASRAGLAVNPVTPQGDFLINLGIRERAKILATANPEAAPSIEAALHRLTAPDQMGDLFKVFVATSPGLAPEGLIR